MKSELFDFTLKDIERFFNNFIRIVFNDNIFGVTLEEKSKILSYSGKEIGKLVNIKIAKENRLELEDIPIYFPDKDGYYLIDNTLKFTTWNYLAPKTNNIESPLSIQDEKISDKISKKNKNKSPKHFDLDKAIIVPGYYAAFALSLYNAFNKKYSSKNIKTALTEISSCIGVKYFRIKERHKSEEKRYLRLQVFFPAETTNKIIYYSNPYKLNYPIEKVAKSFRMPHKSHKNIADLLETPESEKIGLSLTLVRNICYDFEKLNFKKNDCLLSLATSQIPLILYSDSARMLMGSKNLKQVIVPEKPEEPHLKTGHEVYNYGVNAFVVYGLFKGYNYEDGIVISESFAKKMKHRSKTNYSINFLALFNKFEINTFSENVQKFSFETSKKTIFTEINWKVKKGDILNLGDLIARETVFIQSSKGKKVLYEKNFVYNLKYTSKILKSPRINSIMKIDTNTKIAGITLSNIFKMDKPKRFLEKNFTDLPKISFTFPIEVEKPCQIGDKLMGRHGNKGTVSRIIPVNEMPKVKVGNKEKPADAILSPLGVVSRMNLGQLYETHITMGIVEGNLDKKYSVLDPLKKITEKEREEILDSLKKIGSDEFGRFSVIYKNNKWRLAAGYEYMVRLDHCVRDKLHVISRVEEGELSFQPLKGKSRNGGQKFGEMEFWALHSHSSSELINAFTHKNLTKEDPYYYNLPEKQLSVIFKIAGVKIKTDGLKSKIIRNNDIFSEKEMEFLNKMINLNSPFEDYSLALRTNCNNNIDKFINYLSTKIAEGKKEIDDEIKKKYEEFIKECSISKNLFDIVDKNGNRKKTVSMRSYMYNLKKQIYSTNLFMKKLFKKEGYIRSIILGRRLHYSGRAVITPCPELDIDTVFLPIEFGIKFIERDVPSFSQKKYIEALKGNLSKRKQAAEELDVLFEDKYVILNRQPSLHKHSIQSFKIKFWENYTIGLPINVCDGFNADFDGDQMAVYYPEQKSQKIKNELKNMLPSHSPFKIGNGELIYSVGQDIIYGAYSFKNYDKKAVKEEFYNKISELTKKNDYNSIKKTVKELSLNYINEATKKNLTLTIWEIANYQDKTSSMFKIKESKCRGNNKQYKQLYDKIKIETQEKNSEKILPPFYKGIDKEDYFDPITGLVQRSRRTLMDKKLSVGDAGYFTRELVEIMGSVVVSDHIGDKHEISYDKAFLNKIYSKEIDTSVIHKFFADREIQVDEKIYKPNELTLEEIKSLLDKGKIVITFSPLVSYKEGRFYVRDEYCGLNISTKKPFMNGDYIGIISATSIGERGTQLSMQTFHTGGKGMAMQGIKNKIFSLAFSSKNFKEFIKSMVSEEKGIGLENFNKIDVSIIYFEILYNTIQSIKENFDVPSTKKYFSSLERGLLTVLSFESGHKIFGKILNNLDEYENKVFFETQPRVKYAFGGINDASNSLTTT